MSLTEKQIAFIRLANQNGYMTTISRKDAKELCRAHNFKWPRWIAIDDQYRHSRGVYKLPSIGAVETPIPSVSETPMPQATTMNLQTIGTNISESLIPTPNKNYVPFGNFSDVESIISSKMFYPV
jgi:hypothetical protein